MKMPCSPPAHLRYLLLKLGFDGWPQAKKLEVGCAIQNCIFHCTRLKTTFIPDVIASECGPLAITNQAKPRTVLTVIPAGRALHWMAGDRCCWLHSVTRAEPGPGDQVAAG